MRHAEAARECQGRTDSDRPLTPLGESVAALMGRTIADRGSAPELIVSSAATRALQTAELFVQNAGLGIEIMLDERIYEATAQTLFQIVAEFDDAFDSALMVGHNPGFEGFFTFLTGTLIPIRAGAVAVIDLRVPRWKEIAQECGNLIEIYRPGAAA